jgi:hypothetical protein
MRSKRRNCISGWGTTPDPALRAHSALHTPLTNCLEETNFREDVDVHGPLYQVPLPMTLMINN